MNHFEYVSKSKYMPVKKELIKIINQVQDELREQFTFDYKFIGSSSRNMITYDPKTNKGYDFDINIEVNDFDENYSAKELKEILINTFNQVIKLTYPYASCQNKHSCIYYKSIRRKSMLYKHHCFKKSKNRI